MVEKVLSLEDFKKKKDAIQDYVMSISDSVKRILYLVPEGFIVATNTHIVISLEEEWVGKKSVSHLNELAHSMWIIYQYNMWMVEFDDGLEALISNFCMIEDAIKKRGGEPVQGTLLSDEFKDMMAEFRRSRLRSIP